MKLHNLLSGIENIIRSKSYKSSKINQILLVGIILLTGFVLGYLVFSNWDALINFDWNLRPAYIGISFILYSAILFLTVFVWKMVVESIGHKVAFKIHFVSYCISALGKRLPGTLWYIAWRAKIYGNEFSAKFVTFTSGIEMAVTIIAAVITCSIFSIPLILKYKYSIYFIIFLLGMSIIVLHPKFIKWLLGKYNIEARAVKYKYLIVWIIIYIFIWCLIGIMLYAISNIIYPSPITQINYFIGTTALTGVLSRLLFFSPVKFGFGEVSYSLLLSQIMPSSIAVIVALMYRMVVVSFEIIWAIISYTIAKREITN